MEREQYLNSVNKMLTSFEIIKALGEVPKLLNVLEGLGYQEGNLEKVMKFIRGTVTDEEMVKHLEQRAFIDYIKSLDELIGHVKEEVEKNMSQGYQEMGEINLNISNEMKQLEDEGEVRNEMDRKKSKDSATTK